MIEKPKFRIEYRHDNKLSRSIEKINTLIDSLNQKNIPENIKARINDDLSGLADFQGLPKDMRKRINRTYSHILHIVRKELQYVQKNYYTYLWIALGLSVFGIPLGIGLSIAIRGDVALMGAFMAMGLPIGLGIGTELDKKAAREGKQLDI